ncbi:iris-like [Haemaphysalis longicornis]
MVARLSSCVSRDSHSTNSDDALSSEDESSEMDADTKRIREPSFFMAPSLSGCLLQFGVDVCQKLREGGYTRNILISPYMVASSLVMVLHGCASRSPEAEAIGRALHIHWAPFRKARAFEHEAQALFAPFHRPKLRVHQFNYTCFMALFYDVSVPLTASYYRLQERLSYLLDRRDFAESAQQCRLTMDALVRTLSSFSFKPGREVFPPGSVDENSLLVFLSSIRLEGTWRYSFRLVSGDFHETPEATVSVGMMVQRGTFRMCESTELEVTALEVPYENRDVSLVILLPARVDGLTSLEKHVTASKLLHCIARLEERPLVTVCLPLLRLRHVTELSSVLKAMGLGLLFTDRANLRYMTKAEGAHLSSVRHVAVLHVNHKGARPPTESDASTDNSTLTPAPLSSVTPQLLSPELETPADTALSPLPHTHFVVDRPFMLLVLKRRPDVVLLFGSVKKLV